MTATVVLMMVVICNQVDITKTKYNFYRLLHKRKSIPLSATRERGVEMQTKNVAFRRDENFISFDPDAALLQMKIKLFLIFRK